MPIAFAMAERSRGNLLGRIAIACAVLASIAWLVAFAPLPFVASQWRASDPEEVGALRVRQRMADWLVITHRLDGLSHREVVDLLGNPPPHDKFRGAGLVYVLGPERGFISIDYEWLVLTFGKAGTVEHVAIQTD